MVTTFRFTVTTPERTVLEADVASVQAYSSDGSFGVLASHQPMIRALTPHVLHFQDAQGKQRHIALVHGGLFTTDGEKVTVLADTAELDASLDFARAQEAHDRAIQRLEQQQADTDAARAELALQRALLRMKMRQAHH
ncbi:MAG: ATP synthase F1 subunit epsilon [Vampirovibrionales bacterium]